MLGRFQISLFTLIFLSLFSNPCIAQESPTNGIDPVPKILAGDDRPNPTGGAEKTLINDGLSVPKAKESDNTSPLNTESAEDREAALEAFLTGSKLRGQFTMDGKPLTDLQDETYEIRKAHKLKPDSDTWAIHARIKYGEHDVVVPVPIKILWAGSTPVLTMDKMTVPGLGTFSARVVLHGNRYAGTWQHDEVGGHLFGTVEPAAAQVEP